MNKILSCLVMVATFSLAQDFGYEYAMISEYRALAVSRNLQEFSARSSNPFADSGRISISTALPFVEYRQNNGRMAVGYQTFSDIYGNSRESFSVYVESHSDFSLEGTKQSQGHWFIPVAVAANYVRADAPGKKQEDFDIGSFGLGTGIKFKHFDRSIGIQAFVIGSFYYASEGFSTDYGTQTSLCAEVQLFIPELVFEGILIGYRFETQQWNMNNNTLDYQRMYNGFVLGFLF
ncbi:MAG: hypothetical protein WCX28_02110 [Bacteriovoracaceae bacterium]